MPPTIAIIILNWCNYHDTLICLDSVRQLSTIYPLKLIVCDNASPNDSFQQLSQWGQQHFSAAECAIYPDSIITQQTLPAFSLLATGGNLGFAGGNNVGLRYALNDPHCRYIWLLNNDTHVATEALSALLHCATQRPEVALWGSTLLESHAPQQVQCAGGCRYYPLLTIFRPCWAGLSLAQVLQQDPTQIRLDYVAGASLFLSAAAVRKVGMLNEAYFLFYEELDYCQRLKQAGYHIAWCQNSMIWHQGSASVGSVRAGNQAKLKRANYYENLSTLKYSYRFHRRWFWLIAFNRFTLKAAALMVTRRWFLLPALLTAYRDFLLRGDR